MAARTDPFLLVAAIDFGTTFSGYAFSFVSSKHDPTLHEKIRINKSWGANIGFQSYKTPTSVLTTKNDKFLAFGYEAEQMYSQAIEDEDSDDEEKTASPDMLLFRHFKMLLLNPKGVKLTTPVTAVDGTLRPAIDIFAHAIRYLKDHLLKALKLETGSTPKVEDIRWVITVPAIWGDAAKQFMREASHKAGCISTKCSKKLMIALEPEAASFCCRNMTIAHYADPKNISFPRGTKYLVVDCGGGTVDITAHITEVDKKIKEIAGVSGGPWGGTKIDANFREFLENALGKNFLNTYIKQNPHEWLQFLTNFERSKKAFTSDEGSKITISLPYTFGHLYPTMNQGKKIEKTLKAIDGVKCSSGMIVISYQVAKKFFEPVISAMTSHISTLLQKQELKKLDYIFIVGGFSESPFLQDEFKEKFQRNGTKVLIPSEAQMAIIKGAVLFGHRPNDVDERILRKTYGVEVYHIFDPKIHDAKRKVIAPDGLEDCTDIFERIAEKGGIVKAGAVKSVRLTADRDDYEFVCGIFVTELPKTDSILYVDDPNVQKIGEVKLYCERKGGLELRLIFGSTEIQAEVIHIPSGKSATTYIDLLA